MIVGNGLIANCFKKSKIEKNVTIFASGVSNSKISNYIDYSREIDLLKNVKKSMPQNHCLVYFSSCGVVSENSNYYLHKKNMENLIINGFNNYLIFRLPQLIGNSNNNNTLLNNFIQSIKDDVTLNIQKNATRYFIEISDLVFLVNEILKNNIFNNNIYNIAIPEKYKILDILSVIETVLNKKATYQIIEGGVDYNVDLTFITNFLSSINFHYDKNYLESSLKKILK